MSIRNIIIPTQLCLPVFDVSYQPRRYFLLLIAKTSDMIKQATGIPPSRKENIKRNKKAAGDGIDDVEVVKSIPR
jgi:hypothetical protein